MLEEKIHRIIIYPKDQLDLLGYNIQQDFDKVMKYVNSEPIEMFPFLDYDDEDNPTTEELSEEARLEEICRKNDRQLTDDVINAINKKHNLNITKNDYIVYVKFDSNSGIFRRSGVSIVVENVNSKSI